MPTINATREKYYLLFRNDPVPSTFQHEPAATQPTQPTFPGSLTVPQQKEVTDWRQARGLAKATLYAALGATAKTTVDLFIAWDAARRAWESNDAAARKEQHAWFLADAAISNYDAVPKSGSNTGTGSGGPPTPQTKQEP